MAGLNFCAAFILLSMATLVAADGYNYDRKPDGNGYAVKPMEKAGYEKPKTKGNGMFFDNKIPSYEQPREDYEKPKKDYEKAKTEGNGKSLYGKLPNYEQPKSEEKKEQFTIPSKGLDYEKPKKKENGKLPNNYSKYEQQTKKEQEREKTIPTKPYEAKTYEAPSIIRVQGLVYCKTGLKYFPLLGAVAKITCLAVDKQTYKSTRFSVLSKPCDSKGNFYAEISQKYGWNIEDCRAYLNYSPLKTCAIPTNANNGIHGDLLSFAYHTLGNVKPISAGPFFYAAPAQTYSKQPVTNNRY